MITIFSFSTTLALWSNVGVAGEITNSSKIGVGLNVGTLTNGLTAKRYFESNLIIQAFVGTRGVRYQHTFSIGADAMFEKPIREIDHGRLFFGYGGGLSLYSHRRFGFSSIGFSGVGELGIHFSAIPLECIIDVRPSVIIGELGDIHILSGGIATRWFF